MQNTNLKKIAVFCGASAGNHLAYSAAAVQLAEAMADAGITLVYGGANVGLMNILANHMLKNNGRVIGIMPQSLVDVEIAHSNLTELRIVQSMPERKTLIAEMADAFVMLPGGCGSLDEFFEMCTLSQLGYHQKPCSILNVNHYYDHLVNFLDHAVDQGFLKKIYRDMMVIEQSPPLLLQKLNEYQSPLTKRWVNEG